MQTTLFVAYIFISKKNIYFLEWNLKRLRGGGGKEGD